jgi:3-hydroxyacyl-CoA dehydrogenase
MQVDMTGLDAVQAVMEEFAPDTPKRRTLQERKAMLAKGKRSGQVHMYIMSK